MKVEFENLHIPVKEAVIPQATSRDVADTQSEFWRVDEDMRRLIQDLTLDQRKQLNVVISDFVKGSGSVS
jgi:hypothetical protein